MALLRGAGRDPAGVSGVAAKGGLSGADCKVVKRRRRLTNGGSGCGELSTCRWLYRATGQNFRELELGRGSEGKIQTFKNR